MSRKTILLLSSKLLVFITVGLFYACSNPPKHAISTEERQKSVGAPSTLQEVFPPDEFVADLKQSASDIALITITKVDSIDQAIKVFHAKVIRTYKGGLKTNENMKYAGMSEQVIREHAPDTIVVFLVKHQSGLTNIRTTHIYYSTVEENATIKASPHLDSLLSMP